MDALLALIQDTVVIDVSTPGADYALSGFDLLLAAIFGWLASFLTGAIKFGLEKLGLVDAAIVKVIKPFTPLLVMALAAVLPLLGNALGIPEMPSSEILVTAPLATVIGVTTREIVRRFFRPST